MRFKVLAFAGLAVVLVTAPAAAAVARPPEPAAASGFDLRVQAAKTAMMGDPQAALSQAQAALAVARGEAKGDRRSQHLATAQWLQGEALLRLNRLDEAQRAIEEGLAATADAPRNKLRGDLLMAHAGVLASQGRVQAALSGFQAAHGIFAKVGEPRSQAIALMNIGSIYQDARDYPRVLKYYAQAAELYKGDPALLVSARNNIGNALRALKRFPEAEVEFEQARDLARAMQSPLIEAHVLANLATAELEHGLLGQARRHVEEALRIVRAEPSAREAAPGVWGVAAQVELKAGRPEAAVRNLEHTFAGMDLEATSLLERDFHETAYEAYRTLGNDTLALRHLRAFKRLDDEARDLAASTNAALMAARFDFANQSSRIAELKAGQLRKDVQLARARSTAAIILLAGAVICGALLLGALLSIRRSRNEVRAANAKLSVANASLEKAVQARTEFLATTSHEIRTPLNGILGMTQVILAEPALSPELRDKVNVVHGAGEAMRALVDDILDLSRIETGKMVIVPAEVDLKALCDETARLWAEKADAKGIALVLDVARAPARIVADAGRLRQILFNLMSNAIKFTHTGAVTLAVRAEGEALVLAVRDTGIGIPADRLEDIFESFRQVDGSVTRHYEGTGLGLAICRKLARAMGGDIEVESTRGEGSTFTVRIALERPVAATPDVAQAGPAAETLADARILLVDANPLTQAVLRAVLQPQARAVEAVAACEDAQAAASAGRFDLVLCDAAILGATPEARAAAAAALAAAASPAAVAVLVAAGAETEVAAFHAAGVAQVIQKPVPAPALLAALRDGFAQRSLGDRDSSTRSMLA